MVHLARNRNQLHVYFRYPNDLTLKATLGALIMLMQNLSPQLISRAQLEMTSAQVFMLHFIQQTRQLSVSLLAEKMEVAPSAITVMLDRLENRHFVVRVRGKKDRRVDYGYFFLALGFLH